MARVQTRRTIALSSAAYRRIKLAAAARGIPMSQLVDEALGDFTGNDFEASMARAKVEPRRRPGPKPKRYIVGGKAVYIAVAPPRPIRSPMPKPYYPSLERILLGDGIANALGFK